MALADWRTPWINNVLMPCKYKVANPFFNGIYMHNKPSHTFNTQDRLLLIFPDQPLSEILSVQLNRDDRITTGSANLHFRTKTRPIASECINGRARTIFRLFFYAKSPTHQMPNQ